MYNKKNNSNKENKERVVKHKRNLNFVISTA